MKLKTERKEMAIRMFEKYLQPVIDEAVPRGAEEWQLYTASAKTAEQKRRNRLAALAMSKVMDKRFREIAMAFCLMQEEMAQVRSEYSNTGASDTEPRAVFGFGVDALMDALKGLY